MQTIVQVNVGSQGWTGAEKAVNSVRAITLSHANGLASHITGPLGNGADRLRRPAEPGQIAHNPDGGG
jgi:hypothetical protein